MKNEEICPTLKKTPDMSDYQSRVPELLVENCTFWGTNPDGSSPFVYKERKDGFLELVRFSMNGWVCYGPAGPKPEFDEAAERTKAYGAWDGNGEWVDFREGWLACAKSRAEVK